MLFALIDVPIEQSGFFERNSTLLVIVAVASLLALVAFFLWKRKKRDA
jgi:LPXTG-motif cell wall-anchored protein